MEDLRSGIEHLKKAKAHMSEANGIMSGHISKLKELEEENAELRAKLEAWIQSDDSYMKLPLDADGEPIRLGDEVNIDGVTAPSNEALEALTRRMDETNTLLRAVYQEIAMLVTFETCSLTKSANSSVIESIDNTLKTALEHSRTAQVYYESAGKENQDGKA